MMELDVRVPSRGFVETIRERIAELEYREATDAATPDTCEELNLMGLESGVPSIQDQAAFEPKKDAGPDPEPAPSFGPTARACAECPFRSRNYWPKLNRSVKSPMAGELTGT